MNRLKRLRELLAYMYFCFYEEVSRRVGTFPAYLLSFLFWDKRELLNYPPPKRVKLAFEKLGGAFLKIGQLLSTRVDLLPPEFIKELESLQDRVPPQDLKELLKYYPELKGIFRHIDEKPIGSGSVAQVHRGILKNGQEVAVKIIRPNAAKLIAQDTAVLKALAKVSTSIYPPLKEFRVKEVVEEIERMLNEELDLSREGAYMELFRKFSQKEPNLFIPQVFWEYSSRNYLITEFVKGEKLTCAKIERGEREELARKFVHIVHRTIFELGVFHGDLHPGNIFLIKGNRFAFVDFGIVGRLSPDTLQEFFFFSLGVMNKDPDVIVNSLRRIGALPKEVNEKLLKREILVFLDKYYNKPLSQIDAEKLFYEELSTARRFKIVLPEELVILMKTIAHTESIARLIYPDFRLPPLLKPYLKKLAPKFIYEFLKRKSLNLTMKYGELLEEGPKLVKDAVNYQKQSYRELFWGMALIGFSITLIFSPKLLLAYIPALVFADKMSRKSYNS